MGLMQKRKPAIALVLMALAGLGWHWHREQQVEDMVLHGNVDIREVDMAFRQSGRVRLMKYEEGDVVHPGDVLAELDALPFRESLGAADAAVLVAQAELDKLRHGSRTQEIAQAEQNVRKAQAALDYAEAELQRQGSVVSSGATTEHQFDQARSSRDQAAADLAASQETLSLKREGSRQEDIAAAEASLARSLAQQAQARTALADTVLAAPAEATVLTRVREPGSMTSPSATIYTLSLRQPVYVRAYVSEPQLTQVAPGTEVLVEVDGGAHPYHGQVGSVSPRAEFTPKSVETTDLRTALVYRLRIIVADADPSLRQGMPVTVRLLHP